MTSSAAPAVGVALGIYEKALSGDSLEEVFASAARAGFSFVDLSLDESPERLARLAWSGAERQAVRAAAARHGIDIGGLCLSAHRRIAPGSSDPQQRAAALDILTRAIDLCRDLGVPVLQTAGYYAYYEDPRPEAREHYIDVFRAGVQHAARAGVFLGLENVDGTDITSVETALEVVESIDSPWFQLYPDIGNFVVQSRDVVSQLRAAEGCMLALHVKEARPDTPRRVPMGEGDVPWVVAFAELARQAWSGRIMIEMWNDDSPESESIATAAREFVSARLAEAGVAVVPPRSLAGLAAG